MQRNLRMPVNMDFYCGHQALRLAAMGLDARERAATAEEIAVMADLLRDALAAGALGFSSNTMDYDGQGRPVPSLLADDAEFSALFDVLDEFPGKTFQILVSVFMRMTGVEDMKRLEPLLDGRTFKVMWAGVPHTRFPDVQSWRTVGHAQAIQGGRPASFTPGSTMSHRLPQSTSTTR